MITRRELTEAVRALRQHFGETQQQFALRMNSAVITVARWETNRPPSGPALEQLHGLSRTEGVSACEKAFQEALDGDVEPSPNIVRNRLDFLFQNSREKVLALALVTMLRDPKRYAETLRSIEPALAKCLDSFKAVFDAEELDERIARAVVSLHQKGVPPEQIAAQVGVGVDAIERIVMLHQFDLIAPRKVVSVRAVAKRSGTVRSRKKVTHVATTSTPPVLILGNRRLSEVLESKIRREAKQ